MRPGHRFRGAAAACALLLLTAAGAAVAVAEVRPGSGYLPPHDASLEGYRIDSLLNVTSVLVGILFVAMCAWIGMACVRFNSSHVATFEHGDGRKQVALALFISGAIFFVVDGNLFYNSVKDVNGVATDTVGYWEFDKVEADPRTIRVEVQARQWGWDFRQTGPDRKFNTADDVVTFNDLRIPVGAPIYVQLAAVDVLHSLYLPNFRQKMDAIPGMVNALWFEAKETGDFDIACAQHCGVNHYLMRGQITVLEPLDYETWMLRASNLSRIGWREDDPAGNWGWKWQEK
jgi:cytochrome c oxidase subunit 2